MESLTDSTVYAWVILPILIFAARICDVTLGTFRIIFISRGMKYLAAAVGFFEIFIWLLAIGQIFKNLSNIVCYIAYAGGFASGSFLGIYIAEKLSMGKVVLRIITARDATNLIRQLISHNYGVTTLDAEGAEGPVKVIFSAVKRQDLEHVIGIIQNCNPRAFYTIEDIRFASEGIFPQHPSVLKMPYMLFFRPHRKSK